jgi:microcystin-dependent protein
MSNPFIGELRLFGGNFAPIGWAFCQGQLLPIDQNDALYALIGTTFGGDGITTFGLPDLQGRVVIGQGQGPGLSSYVVGQKSGTETVTLTTGQLPSHNHTLTAYNTPATTASPAGGVPATTGKSVPNQANNSLFYASASVPNATTFPADTIQNSGGNQPHENMAPFLVINYIIALEGVFPSRN